MHFRCQMYGLIWLTQIPSKVQDCDVLVMLTSALCHDLDHPGYNNAYQVSISDIFLLIFPIFVSPFIRKFQSQRSYKMIWVTEVSGQVYLLGSLSRKQIKVMSSPGWYLLSFLYPTFCKVILTNKIYVPAVGMLASWLVLLSSESVHGLNPVREHLQLLSVSLSITPTVPL